MGSYGIVDLEGEGGAGLAVESIGWVDTDDLRAQLADIRDSLGPLLADEGPDLRLSSLEVSLTVGAEGKVLFVAKGSLEASIKLTFSRPDAVG